MAKPINIYDAKTNLSALVERAAGGEEIVIAKKGRPMARLVPLQPATPLRTIKPFRGKWTIAPDWDAPLSEETLRLFEGESE